MLFGDPELNDDSEDAFDKYIYLTQLSQAVCTTEQVNGIFTLCILVLLDIYSEFQLDKRVYNSLFEYPNKLRSNFFFSLS